MNIEIYLFSASDIKISQLKSLDEKHVSSFVQQYEKNINWVKNFMEKYKIKWTILNDDVYHFKFFSILSKPYIYYFKWNQDLLNRKIIWIVWPRRPTDYAVRVLEELFKYLKKYKNIVTVSWMAPWVDSLVHKFSIENWIPTIAILGGWLGWYLKYKTKQIEYIISNWWLVISEFRLFQEPTKYTFPQRNRIIAGLSDFLFLPEAWKNSWSLITVDFACKMKKSVFWTPNSIFVENSQWINRYISEGKIKLIYDIEKFLKENLWEYSLKDEETDLYIELNDLEKKVYQNIWEKSSIQDLVFSTWIDFSNLMVILTNLEIKWLIKQIMPWVYEKI